MVSVMAASATRRSSCPAPRDDKSMADADVAILFFPHPSADGNLGMGGGEAAAAPEHRRGLTGTRGRRPAAGGGDAVFSQQTRIVNLHKTP